MTAPQACSSPVMYSNLTDGDYTFSVSAVDRAGNQAKPESSDFLLDTTPPSIDHISFPQGSQTGNLTVTFAAEDSGSGIDSTACK